MERELQLKIIYSIIVAGKSAEFANSVVSRMFDGYRDLPFDVIDRWIKRDILPEKLKLNRTGGYTKLEKSLKELVESGVDLSICCPEDLEKIYGIGPKTSRFFIVWTRPWEEYAVLDVHILKWMRSIGYRAPRSSPGSIKSYRKLELLFIAEAKLRGKTPRELDLEIWKKGSGNENIV